MSHTGYNMYTFCSEFYNLISNICWNFIFFLKIGAVTYIRVTRNTNKIPILNSNNTVVYLTQVKEGNSISFIYTFTAVFEYTA